MVILPLLHHTACQIDILGNTTSKAGPYHNDACPAQGAYMTYTPHGGLYDNHLQWGEDTTSSSNARPV